MQGVQFLPLEFWKSLYREFNVVNLMQRAKILARISKDFPPSKERLLSFLTYPVAMGVRAHLLTVGLYTFAKSISSEYGASHGEDFLGLWLDSITPESMPTLHDCHAGMDEALHTLMEADVLDDINVLSKTASLFRRSAYARLDASKFLSAADEFGAATTQLDILRELVHDPSSPDLDRADRRMEFYLLTAVSPNFETPRLFYIPLVEMPPSIVVFKSSVSASSWADGFAAKYLYPSETVDIIRIDTHHAANVKTYIDENFGPDFTLVVEGTRAFDRLTAARETKTRSKESEEESVSGSIRQRKADALADRYRLYTAQTKNAASLEQFAEIIHLIEDL
jgi:hypothetical protein